VIKDKIMKINKLNRLFLLFAVAIGMLVNLNVSAQKQKVSCIGNSITYGYGLSNPSTQSYPAQLQVLLGTTEYEVENFGSSGRTMLKSG
jgi:sialate O-acetylesterase